MNLSYRTDFIMPSTPQCLFCLLKYKDCILLDVHTDKHKEKANIIVYVHKIHRPHQS